LNLTLNNKRQNINTLNIKIMSKVQCPNCGAKFETEKENEVRVESNKQRDTPKGHKNANKVQSRLAALKAAGVDISNYQALINADGDGTIIRLKGNTFEPVLDSDPIWNNIINSGTVPNHQLFRRWIMSQVFHSELNENGVTYRLKRMGYNAQWKLFINELNAEAKMCNRDKENYAERTLFYKPTVIAQKMIKDYKEKLIEYIDTLPEHCCHGIPYKRIGGKDVFMADIEKTYLYPITKFLAKLLSPCNCHINEAEHVYGVMKEFTSKKNEAFVKLPFETNMCEAFVSAYKGVGAYYTLKNMVLFHGYFINMTKGTSRYGKNTTPLYSREALDYIRAKAQEYQDEGWKLYGLMRQAIRDNNIDIRKKIESWHK
jgi:hypothetical protein